jgi:hypothetical protein
MKRTLVAIILGMAALAPKAQADGYIHFDNYIQSYTAVTFSTGDAVSDGFTAGLYWALSSSQSASAQNAAMAGDGWLGTIPTLSLSDATTPIGSGGGLPPGFFSSPTAVALSGADNQSVTLVVVAYNGATYESSTVRGHTAAFEMTAIAFPNIPLECGPFMPALVVPVPEPSMFAVAGLGAAALMILRRRIR